MMRPALRRPAEPTTAMRTAPIPVLLALTLTVAVTDAVAQGRGRGRPDEITNRVGVFFTDVAGPQPADGEAGALAAVDLVRAGASAGQPTVLYLVDGRDDADVREQFERALFAADDLGILLRCFHCGRIDLKGETALAARYGKQAPLFVVFDRDGKGGEIVAMAGYKASAKALETQLLKAAQGLVKPSMPAFVKEYAGLVRELEQLLAKRKNGQERLAKAGAADKAKRAEIERDLAAIAKEEQKLLGRERELLDRIALPERSAEARRLGGRGFGGGDRGGRGGGGGNGGNGGNERRGG